MHTPVCYAFKWVLFNWWNPWGVLSVVLTADEAAFGSRRDKLAGCALSGADSRYAGNEEAYCQQGERWETHAKPQ